MHRRSLISLTLAGLLVVVALAGHVQDLAHHSVSARPAAAATTVTVLARHLDQPKKLTVTSDGDLLVALSGDGKAPTSCTDSAELSCEDHSGAVDEVTPAGAVSTLASGLTSISSGHDDPQATGPVEAQLVDGRLQVLFQDLDLDARTGTSRFGTAALLGDLVSLPSPALGTDTDTQASVEASLGAYEARHEPDRHVLGSAVKYGWEAAINSDPYSFVAYRGGWAVADAGANDVLWISPTGTVSLLAVLPTISERARPKTFGSKQKTAITAAAQAVPTAIAVGPDGDLYVGELGGEPFAVGSEDIYRIAPGRRATVWARGLTSIGDIAFDADGDLLVLELDQKGLSDPGLEANKPASGELVAIAQAETAADPRAGARTVLVSRGLTMPTGLAVAQDGDIYLTNDGTATNGGEILRVTTTELP